VPFDWVIDRWEVDDYYIPDWQNIGSNSEKSKLVWEKDLAPVYNCASNQL